MNITAVTPAQVLHAVESRDRQCRCQGYPEEPFTRPAPPLGQPKASATPRLTNAKSLLDELRSGRRTMETICQSVSVDPRRTTADSMVGRVVGFPSCRTADEGNRVSSSGLAKGEVSCCAGFRMSASRALDALGRPASEKRQGTKSREVGRRRCRGLYGDLAAASGWARLDQSGRPNGCGRRAERTENREPLTGIDGHCQRPNECCCDRFRGWGKFVRLPTGGGSLERTRLGNAGIPGNFKWDRGDSGSVRRRFRARNSRIINSRAPDRLRL